MKVDWTTITTVALTAVTTILASIGVITNDESTSLVTTGAGAITGVSALVTTIITVWKAHKKSNDAQGK